MTDAPPDDATPPENDTTTTPPAADMAAEAAKWKALARKHEDQAKANADKAKRFDALEEASKTELEKATARAEAAEQALVTKTLDNDRLSAAIANGLEPDLASFLTGTTVAEIDAQAKLLASRLTTATTAKPAVKSLKSGASASDAAGLTGKERAAAAVRQLRGQP